MGTHVLSGTGLSLGCIDKYQSKKFLGERTKRMRKRRSTRRGRQLHTYTKTEGQTNTKKNRDRQMGSVTQTNKQ